ncbi:MAG: AAA family ATPase, partial [Nitriliruptorales bacterium]|nr:AAA family ATPase [Nitriliruptorales bacterium]
MFLKSLSLRGFKSFADRTVLEFEPGVTVIVGPNGSGKSNIVDAFTWVLGSHSPKSLRGGSMSDVIFAGSGIAAEGNGRNGAEGGQRSGRPALGRASAEITIDNSRGALPIEFTEVTIGRAMFATGETSYTINDVECRLLDVQELLSDTGLGRESHTIVGQGQLETVLNARPEDRRAFIEEAAGI